MEATLFNVPAIALSQSCRNGHPVKWATAEQHAPGIISRLFPEDWQKDLLININFPDCAAGSVKGTQVTTQGKRKLGDELLERIDPRGEPYVWIGGLRVEEVLPERHRPAGGGGRLHLGDADPHGHDPSRQLRAASARVGAEAAESGRRS